MQRSLVLFFSVPRIMYLSMIYNQPTHMSRFDLRVSLRTTERFCLAKCTGTVDPQLRRTLPDSFELQTCCR